MPYNLSGAMFQTTHYGRHFTTFVVALSKEHATNVLREFLPDYTFEYVGRTTLGEFVVLDKSFFSQGIPSILFRSDSGLIFTTAAETTDFLDDEEAFHAECLRDNLNNPEPEEWSHIDGDDYSDIVSLRD